MKYNQNAFFASWVWNECNLVIQDPRFRYSCLVSIFGVIFNLNQACLKLWHCPFGCFVNCNLQWNANLFWNAKTTEQVLNSRGLFLESPETFRVRHNSLCIFKRKASRGTYLYSLYNIWEDQLYTINRSEFCEWLFGPEKFSGLSRNGPEESSRSRYESESSISTFSFFATENSLFLLQPSWHQRGGAPTRGD